MEVRRSRLMLFPSFLILSALLMLGSIVLSPANTGNLYMLIPGFLFGIASVILYFVSIQQPAVRLEEIEADFIRNDLQQFRLAILELSQGNLSFQPKLSPEKTALHVPGDLASLAEKHSRITGQIRESLGDLRTITENPCKRLVYVGADSYLEGKKCGEMMEGVLGGSGKVLIIQGSFLSTSQNLRVKGFVSRLMESGSRIRIVDILEDNENDGECRTIVIETLKRHPDLAGIYVSNGSSPPAAADALEKQGSRVRIVCHDLAEGTMAHMRKGTISATLSQNAFAQGYDPAIMLYNYLKTGVRPVNTRQLTLLEEVTQQNLHEHWSERTGILQTGKSMESLVHPVENPENTRFLIGFILTDDKQFWKQVSEGVHAATDLLASHNTEVKVVIDEAIRNKNWTANAFIPVIDALLRDGCRGIALPIFDRELVPYLNGIIDRGIAVASYNAEPAGFRSMMDAVSNHASHLCTVSENLAAGAMESNRATVQISGTMKTILDGTLEQLSSLEKTDETLKRLATSISVVGKETESSTAAARETIRTATVGFQSVRDTQSTMSRLTEATEKTGSSMRLLSEDIRKIRQLATTIEEISSRTNVLAINASIQAANSGEAGKGFSVIAKDIRHLAEQSAKSTNVINTLIESILARVEESTKLVAENIGEVGVIAENVNRTADAFTGIMNASSENERKIEVIAREMGEIDRISAAMKDAMGKLVAMNEDNSTAVEEITASAEQLSRQAGDFSASAQMLADMGHSQENLIAMFLMKGKS